MVHAETQQVTPRDVFPSTEPLTLTVDGDILKVLGLYGTRQVYRSGQTIFYEGHRPIGLYLHESGRIAFTKEGRIVRRCADTCLIGAPFVLADSRLPVSACAEEEVSVVFVGRSGLFWLREEYPAVYNEIRRVARVAPH